MPIPSKTIMFAIDTIEDLQWNSLQFDFLFVFFEKLIISKHEFEFHRIGHKNEPLTIVRDLNHLNNFKKNYDFPRS